MWMLVCKTNHQRVTFRIYADQTTRNICRHVTRVSIVHQHTILQSLIDSSIDTGYQIDRGDRLMLDTCTLYISSSNKLDEESWRDQMDCWKINKFISWLTLFDFWEKGRKVCSRKYNKSSLLHLKFPHTLNTPNKVQITWFELQWNVCSAQTNCGKSYKLTWDG